MKKLVLIFSLFSCLYFSFAQTSFSSVYSKPRRLYVRQTQYFDFIYPKDSRLTVDLLIDKVDASYEKLADYLNVEKKLRFPVVVSPDTDILNAYFMPMPYNRIVLFDTVSSDKDDVYASTLLDVFEHELTHALSLNIKTSAWKVASYVVGDMASPVAVWSLPALFVEGISVFTESMDGKHGRLNDDLTMQMLIQAKMEKRFPTWQEVSGAKDTYPTGNTSYIFGGAFCAF
ncbi:MAG: hypothetical protein IIW10_02065, partial [Spirochaetaceae bacterium]|nr:hypothetical protein [Spirochaetaceae bacterium]